MKSKLKALGVCVVAVFAMSVVVASAAQADEFHAESATAYFTGNSTSSDHAFTITKPAGTVASTVTCSTVNLKGESGVTTTKEISLAPSYSKCFINQNLKAVVSTTGCTYKIKLPGTAGVTNATVDIVGGSCVIEIVSLICTIKVAPQTNLEHIGLATAGAGKERDIKATITISGIAIANYGGGCPGAGVVGTPVGDYTGTSTVLGYSNAAHTVRQGIFVA